jgi:hypothetical protein
MCCLTKTCAGTHPNNDVSCNNLEEEEEEERKDEEEEDDDTDKGSPFSSPTKNSPTRLAPTVASASTNPPQESRGTSPHCAWVSVAAWAAAASSPGEEGE